MNKEEFPSAESLRQIIRHADIAGRDEPHAILESYIVVDKDGHIVADYENQIDALLSAICPPSTISKMAAEILELRAQVAEFDKERGAMAVEYEMSVLDLIRERDEARAKVAELERRLAVKVVLPALPEELQEFYPSMSAGPHEWAIKEYAKTAIRAAGYPVKED